MKKVSFLMIALLLSVLSMAQDSVDIYLARNRMDYKRLKRKNFSEQFLLNNPGVYLYHQDCVLTKKSSLILTGDIRINRANNRMANAIALPQNYVVNVRGKGKRKVVVVKLKKIQRRILHKQQTTIKVEYDSLEVPVPVTYASFPFQYDPDYAIERWYGAYKEDYSQTLDSGKANNNSKDFVLHDMVRSIREPMYVGLPYWKVLDPPNPDLNDNEGGNGYILEGNFSMPFTVMQGREDQSTFWRSASVSIDPEFTWRITNDKTSSPLLPLNTKVGITLQRSSILSRGDRFEDSKSNNLNLQEGKKFRILNYGIQGMHYSNGQDEGVFVDSANTRVDFQSGNFSTNYFQLKTTMISMNRDHSMTAFGLGLQFDGPFLIAEFEEEQKGTYGQSRLNFMYQLRSSSRIGCLPFRFRNHKIKKDKQGNDEVLVPSLVEHVFRLDGEYVLESVDNPLSLRARYTINPLRNRATGYFIQGTYGRDYLNIRYRLNSFSLMVGLTFTLNKYRPSKRFIEEKLLEANNFYDDPQFQKKSGKTKYLKQWCNCILK